MSGNRFCRECGAELNTNAGFCGECGTKIKHLQTPLNVSNSPKKYKKKKPKKRLRYIIPTIIISAVFGYFLLTLYLTDGKLVPSYITAVSLSPDNNRLMSVGTDQYLQVWDMDRGKSINRRRIPSGYGITTALAWDPDNRFIALNRTYPIPTDNEVQFFNSKSLRKTSSISTGPDVVVALCIDPDGNTLYSVTNRLGISVWDIQKGEKLGGLEDLPDRLVTHAVFDRQCQRITTIEGATSKNDNFDMIDAGLVVYQRINMETIFEVSFDDMLSIPDLVGMGSNGKAVKALSDYGVQLQSWNLETGKMEEVTINRSIYASTCSMGRENNVILGGEKGLINIYSNDGRLAQSLRHGSGFGIILQVFLD